MENQIYYLSIKYQNPKFNQYGKLYFSFDAAGKLIYDKMYLYRLQDIDWLFQKYSEEEIINQIKEDNVLYDLEEDNLFAIQIMIQYQEKGKERELNPLTHDCACFDIQQFFQKNLTPTIQKIIHNKLGGYLANSHSSKQMKDWIRMLQKEEKEKILENYLSLPYLEQRKIKVIIYEILNQKYIKENESRKIDLNFKRTKKLLEEDKAA